MFTRISHEFRLTGQIRRAIISCIHAFLFYKIFELIIYSNFYIISLPLMYISLFHLLKSIYHWGKWTRSRGAGVYLKVGECLRGKKRVGWSLSIHLLPKTSCFYNIICFHATNADFLNCLPEKMGANTPLHTLLRSLHKTFVHVNAYYMMN